MRRDADVPNVNPAAEILRKISLMKTRHVGRGGRVALATTTLCPSLQTRRRASLSLHHSRRCSVQFVLFAQKFSGVVQGRIQDYRGAGVARFMGGWVGRLKSPMSIVKYISCGKLRKICLIFPLYNGSFGMAILP